VKIEMILGQIKSILPAYTGKKLSSIQKREIPVGIP
jgi:hypothetical protein